MYMCQTHLDYATHVLPADADDWTRHFPTSFRRLNEDEYKLYRSGEKQLSIRKFTDGAKGDPMGIVKKTDE